ncbi:IQ domain-containing protein H [Platysternon megacephalum]|uniref:IQ domain-containing protein H n=1 Tax=Platysternon megacephalum TaxID=55544 RepID=A0A4D9EQZ0_9SAUR|nr:IQ domain-containing protein H [Platysternon megacephalum]
MGAMGRAAAVPQQTAPLSRLLRDAGPGSSRAVGVRLLWAVVPSRAMVGATCQLEGRGGVAGWQGVKAATRRPALAERGRLLRHGEADAAGEAVAAPSLTRLPAAPAWRWISGAPGWLPIACTPARLWQGETSEIRPCPPSHRLQTASVMPRPLSGTQGTGWGPHRGMVSVGLTPHSVQGLSRAELQ